MPILSINIVALLASALIGAVLGSFYACSAYRYIEGWSLTNPRRSVCPQCELRIRWYDNIPLLSYLLLGGKCRSCKKRISLFYPGVELVSILWSVSLMLKFGIGMHWAVYMVLGGIMIVAAAIDLKTFILPDILTIPGAILAICALVLLLGENWREVIWGAVIGGGLFMSLRLIYRGLRGEDGLGLGDVKLMFMIGAMSGPQDLPLVITVAAATGLVAGLGLFRFLPGDDGQGHLVPFGPFLVLGSMLSTLYADWFWLFYIN